MKAFWLISGLVLSAIHLPAQQHFIRYDIAGEQVSYFKVRKPGIQWLFQPVVVTYLPFYAPGIKDSAGVGHLGRVYLLALTFNPSNLNMKD